MVVSDIKIETHVKASFSFTYIGAIILYSYNLISLNYYLALILLILFCKVGATFPDLDLEWKNIQNKTLVNFIINKIIYFTKGRHRSWQTHSWDICIGIGILGYMGLNRLQSNNLLNHCDYEVLFVIFAGFMLGWCSHLFTDMLTTRGVRLFFFLDYKITLVPRISNKKKVSIMFIILFAIGFYLLNIGNLYGIIIVGLSIGFFCLNVKYRNSNYSTGSKWEDLVYKIVKILNVITAFISIIYPWLYNTYIIK